jgi:hypothetical protein
VQEILVDGSELGFQHIVQNGNDFCVAFHNLPFSSFRSGELFYGISSQFPVLSSQ